MSDRSDWPSGLTTLSDQDNHCGLENTTADERVGMMWQLAVEACALKGESVAEQADPPRRIGREMLAELFAAEAESRAHLSHQISS